MVMFSGCMTIKAASQDSVPHHDMPKQTDTDVMAGNAIATLCAQPHVLLVTLAVTVVCAACIPGANACRMIDGNIGLQSR